VVTVKRLAVVAALGAMGVLAPISSANAAGPPAALARPVLPFVAPAGATWPLAGWGGLTGGAFVGARVGGAVAVIGPTVITTAPSTFVNTNIQVSASGNAAGGQVG
jgi:hypothetical protein